MGTDSKDLYHEVCCLIREFYKPSELELFDSYFRSQSLGALSPSQFLRKSRSDLDRLQPGSSTNSDIIRRFFLSVLPHTARAILAGSDNANLDDLASIADKIMLNLPSPSISNVESSIHDLISDLSKQVASLQHEVSTQRRSRPFQRNSSPDRGRSKSVS